MRRCRDVITEVLTPKYALLRKENPMTTEPPRMPLPPFTRETATRKVRLAEDGWNSRDAAKVTLAYSPDSAWRNRAEFPRGRKEI